MIIQRSVISSREGDPHFRAMVGELPEKTRSSPPSVEDDVDEVALGQMDTVRMYFEPPATPDIQKQFARYIGHMMGVRKIVAVEWAPNSDMVRSAGYPEASISFTDGSGWSYERVTALLNATDILGKNVLCGLYRQAQERHL
jgi:hypothetical protein